MIYLMDPLLWNHRFWIHPSSFKFVHLSHFLGWIPRRALLAQREGICLRHLIQLPNCLSGKLDQFRLPLAVYQNVCLFQSMLSLNFVSHFNICQCNRLKMCISLKLNVFSSFMNYLSLPTLFFPLRCWTISSYLLKLFVY